MTELLNYFLPDGVWAVLSGILIFYILKSQEKRDTKQDEREQNYQKIISDLTESLKDVHEIKALLDEKLK
ncbi:BhlA/UviB family holin-like peptide [Acetanaerobacterium elongatum]|uniref:BhlA holin family protein n=1 Tax=Acetanaerobacterium elongatum TaxID=258515 RepID=A0A1H0H4X7_9FIRM|nr:BhlA/UviB family holin-like peptide [Acetanaerobacterium elongatum]SDO14175.1 BhlA holin family protein [Acetanaerobacterium elongatum]